MSKEKVDLKDFYAEMEKQGKTNVDDLVQWLKDAKILETIDKSEKEAKDLFKGVEDKSNVTRAQFEQAMLQMQKEGALRLEDMTKMLLQESNKFFNAIQKAAKNFQTSIDNKEKPQDCSVA